MSTPHPSRFLLPMVAAAGVACFVFTAAYAFKPLAPRPLPSIDLPAPTVPQEESRSVLNLTAFSAPLWVNAPEPAAPAPQPPPAPLAPDKPLRLQLIAILEDTARGRLAALHDLDADRIHFVARGEQVGAYTVLALDAASVDLGAAGGTRRLDLQRPAPADLRSILREAAR